VRILNTVKQNNKTFLRGIGNRRPDDVVKRGCGTHGCKRDHSLMLARAGEPVELPAIFKAHRNAFAAGELNQFLNPLAMAAASQNDARKRAPGFERFADGVNAGQTVHGASSLQVAGAS